MTNKPKMRTLTVPEKDFPHFAGEITVYDPIPYSIYIEWMRHWQTVVELDSAKKQKKEDKKEELSNSVRLVESEIAMWKAISAMVISNTIGIDDFTDPPATPRLEIVKLQTWMIRQISDILSGNESPKG